MIATAFAWFKGVSLLWKLAPIVLLVLGVGGYVLWLRADNASLERDLLAARRDAAIYEEAARRTAESLDRLRSETESARRIVGEATARSRTMAVEADRLEREIRDAPDGDAPAGALADSVLDRLRELTAAGD